MPERLEFTCEFGSAYCADSPTGTPVAPDQHAIDLARGLAERCGVDVSTNEQLFTFCAVQWSVVEDSSYGVDPDAQDSAAVMFRDVAHRLGHQIAARPSQEALDNMFDYLKADARRRLNG